VALAVRWQHPAMSAVLLEHSASTAFVADRNNNHVKTWADVSCLRGHSDNEHEAMERWRQRKAERRAKRSQNFHVHCGGASLSSERTDVQHGCHHLSGSLVPASSITSFARSLHKSSVHSPLTDRGTLSDDAAFNMYMRSQLIHDSGVSDVNADSVAPTISVTEIAVGKTVRRVWSLEPCEN